jgi:hypothetical protein
VRPPAAAPPPSPAPAARVALGRLRAAGLSDEVIARRLAERLAARFGIRRVPPADVTARLGIRDAS